MTDVLSLKFLGKFNGSVARNALFSLKIQAIADSNTRDIHRTLNYAR